MRTRIFLATVGTAALIVTGVLAQATNPSSPTTPSATPGQSSSPNVGPFVENQSSDQWLASKLIRRSVYGSDGSSIGSISDLVVDHSGNIVAAVIGVGGFLGIGQKDVAVPFHNIEVMPASASGSSALSSSDDRLVVHATKDELKSAPSFTPYQPPAPAVPNINGATPRTSPGVPPSN